VFHNSLQLNPQDSKVPTCFASSSSCLNWTHWSNMFRLLSVISSSSPTQSYSVGAKLPGPQTPKIPTCFTSSSSYLNWTHWSQRVPFTLSNIHQSPTQSCRLGVKQHLNTQVPTVLPPPLAVSTGHIGPTYSVYSLQYPPVPNPIL
jgi:hypothetical protein